MIKNCIDDFCTQAPSPKLCIGLYDATFIYALDCGLIDKLCTKQIMKHMTTGGYNFTIAIYNFVLFPTRSIM